MKQQYWLAEVGRAAATYANHDIKMCQLKAGASCAVEGLLFSMIYLVADLPNEVSFFAKLSPLLSVAFSRLKTL